MQNVADFVSPLIFDYTLNSSIIQDIQGCVNEDMKVDDWISLILSNRECIILKFNKGIFVNKGFVLNDEKVLKLCGNIETDNTPHSCDSIERGIVDLDHGARFEGLILKESRIPFGIGEMYDNDGLLVYAGVMINWKRFGYGVSFHNNGFAEYEGYWCDDKRFGSGKLYDRSGKLVKECEWWNGVESNTDVYEGDGSQPISIATKHLKLEDNCVLKYWDVSLLCNLESIEIGDDCFEFVPTFKIDGLNRLKSLKIGRKSFTPKKNWYGNNQSKSFRILNCESLESIRIGEYSFSDFSGSFELKNLKSLQSIQIGEVELDSRNFFWSSFVIRGSDSRVVTDLLDLPSLQSITLGYGTFAASVSTVIESIDQFESAIE